MRARALGRKLCDLLLGRLQLHRLAQRRLVRDRIVVRVDELPREDGDCVDLALVEHGDAAVTERRLDEGARGEVVGVRLDEEERLVLGL